ncbi:MAG: energy transducer TonB [Candidatus Margulisbacteria bacterium]|nr:energy transducer TonB [Candidatus Margulisiibacteriota bacterium]MBU1617234.1 energy transducer TonB [Candidatus Margulisiibacteriota bacterium]MBU1867483.1 energy transducer TonB [Candidatus Margulisiibacteriota bacterium]
MKELTLPRLGLFLIMGMGGAAALFFLRTNLDVDRNYPVFAGAEVRAVQAVAAPAKAAPVAVAKASEARQTLRPIRAVPLPIVPPTIAHQVVPLYPQAAQENGSEGVVLLSVYVSELGEPWKVDIKSSSGYSDLDAAASKALWQWRFNPASQSGGAIASWFEVPVKFALE